MTSPFRKQIQIALKNPSLQAALDGNANRRLAARKTGYASLDVDPQILRERAHAIRQETIQSLDRYLKEFTRNLQTNGIIVHRAETAAQAVKLVLEIIQSHAATRVVKSKTMVGEEIEINSALEHAGMEVVETDLGEWIVQLRGERPAHIITPAVHLRRDEVARLFEEKIGLPYTENISELTAAARKTLRQAFLEAQVGISGVNFGVAETGTICLLTNEGNGRMATTLPPLHIALMGLERLVPTLDDLGLMLALLPRAATGQKLTVYTNLIHSPRRTGEPDGPLERHIILLDNGRMNLRGSPLEEILLCIRCGACLNACPVFRELGGHAYVGKQGQPTPYSGPVGSVLSAGLFGNSEFGQLARASSLCGACKEACPVIIDLPKLLLRVRAGIVPGNHNGPKAKSDGPEPVRAAVPLNVPLSLNWGLRFFGWLTASPRRFSAAQHLAGTFSNIFIRKVGWLRLPALTGWGYSRDLPKPARQSFQERLRSTQVPQISAKPVTGSMVQQNPNRHIPSSSLAVAMPAKKFSKDELVTRFREELELLEGTFIACRREDLGEQVLQVLNGFGCQQIITWEGEHLPEGLLETLVRAGINPSHHPNPEIKFGLTGAIAAAAETGTILLPGGKGRPLTASLLPEVHVAILEADRIYKSLPEILQLREVRDSSSTALISGPSRTADIEMTLTIGVHGPGKLIVFCMT